MKKRAQQPTSEPSVETTVEIMSSLERCRIDRERLFVVRSMLKSGKVDTHNLEMIFGFFDHETYKVMVLRLFESVVEDKQVLLGLVKKLLFYSDRKTFLVRTSE